MPERLTQKAVQKAIDAGDRGVASEIGDAQTRGLFLRVRATGRWTWTYRRTVDRTDYRIDFGNDWTLDEARGLAQEMGVDLRTRRKNLLDEYTRDNWLLRKRSERAGKQFVPIPPPPPPPPKPEPMGVLWRDAQAAWRAEVERTRRETTAYTYDMALKVPEFRPLHDRPVDKVTREDVAAVLSSLAKRGAERQAELSAIACRRLFAWLGDDAQRVKYKVQPGIMAGLKAPERTLKESEDEDDGSEALHVPTGQEIGSIVRWLREDHENTTERDRLAALLTVYSVQRRRYVARARKQDFEEVDGHGGLWSMPPIHRKTASLRKRRRITVGSHVIPLPPSAWAIVARGIELAGDSPWLFPAKKARRKETPKTAMHPSTLTHFFGDVRAAIDGAQATPHDVRRAFGTTFAESADLDDHEIKTILDHSEGVVSGDITRTHYSFRDGTHRKWPIMRKWCDWVDAQADAKRSLKVKSRSPEAQRQERSDADA